MPRKISDHCLLLQGTIFNFDTIGMIFFFFFFFFFWGGGGGLVLISVGIYSHENHENPIAYVQFVKAYILNI